LAPKEGGKALEAIPADTRADGDPPVQGTLQGEDRKGCVYPLAQISHQAEWGKQIHPYQPRGNRKTY